MNLRHTNWDSEKPFSDLRIHNIYLIQYHIGSFVFPFGLLSLTLFLSLICVINTCTNVQKKMILVSKHVSKETYNYDHVTFQWTSWNALSITLYSILKKYSCTLYDKYPLFKFVNEHAVYKLRKKLWQS